jgi:hypothetical protein
MSESVTVERGVRDCFSPQNEQLPVRQNESGVFAGDQGMKKGNWRGKTPISFGGWVGLQEVKKEG